jgi:CheY-like chemotaxis protein
MHLFLEPNSLIVRTGVVGSPIQRHLGASSDGSFLTISMSEKSLPIGCIDHTPGSEFAEITGMKLLIKIVRELSGTVLVTDAGGKLRRIRCIVPMPNEQGSAEKHGRETILLVEDEEFVRNVSREVLELSGYNVLEAIDAEMGIKIFREEADQIDLLLTDVVMPGMNGHDLALKLFETSPTLRVIFMSGYTENAITRQGLSDPRLVYLQKPFTLDVLTKKVREVLDAAASAAPKLGFLPATGQQPTRDHV